MVTYNNYDEFYISNNIVRNTIVRNTIGKPFLT